MFCYTLYEREGNMELLDVTILIDKINALQSLLPDYIHNEVIRLVITYNNNPMFCYFFKQVCEIAEHENSSCSYVLELYDDENTMTPVRELFDLLDGYIIYVEFSWTKEQRPQWMAYALEKGE